MTPRVSPHALRTVSFAISLDARTESDVRDSAGAALSRTHHRLSSLQSLDDMIGTSMEDTGRTGMSLGMIVLIVVVLLLFGAFPAWPHSR